MIPARRILAAMALCVAAGSSQAAGLRIIEVPADFGGPALTGIVWTPCAQAADRVAVDGFIPLPGTRDCPIPGGRKPLVVLSHGHGGTVAGHHDTAEALADAGFVVAAINHPGDTARDLSQAQDVALMVRRPTDIHRLIDHLVGPSPLAEHIDSERIGFFGFSRGGYTGLVLLGATPDWAAGDCNRLSRWCAQRRAGTGPDTPLTRDPRIKAAVIADPLAMFFTADSLAAIRVPVLLWSSERGGDGVTPRDIATLDARLPAGHEHRVVANAGHFAFLAPCPPPVAQARPELCTDAPGFDRNAFHRRLNAETVAFLKTRLAGAD